MSNPYRGEYKSTSSAKVHKIADSAKPYTFPPDRAERIAKHSVVGTKESGPEDPSGALGKCDHTPDSEYLGPYKGR